MENMVSWIPGLKIAFTWLTGRVSDRKSAAPTTTATATDSETITMERVPVATDRAAGNDIVPLASHDHGAENDIVPAVSHEREAHDDSVPPVSHDREALTD